MALTTATAHAQQLQNGLVAHYNFNGDVKDVTGNGHDGTPYNITYTTGMTGQPNSAAHFNGGNSYVTTPFQSDLNLKKYSICAAVKLDGFYNGLCQGNYIVGRGGWPSSYGYSMVVYDNAYNDCYTSDSNKYVISANAGDAHPRFDSEWQHNPNIHTGRWYTMVATYDTKEFRIYLDCELVNVVPVYSGTMTDNNTAGLNIGYNALYTNSYPYWFHGDMDDVRIYDRVLNPNEISMYCEIVNGIYTSYMPTYDYERRVEDEQTTTIHNINAAGVNNLSMYPNPNNGSFTLNGNIIGSSDVSITVINAIGQTVYTTTVHVNNGMLKETINLNSSLPAGAYLINVKTDRAQNAIRFQKN